MPREPDLEVRKYKHIFFCTHLDRLYRVLYPMGPKLYFLVPITSLQEEYDKDMLLTKHLKKTGPPQWPSAAATMDPDDFNDWEREGRLEYSAARPGVED